MGPDNTNRHFKGQQRNEKITYFTRKHWITLMNVFIQFVVATPIALGLVLLALASRGETKEFLEATKWGLLVGAILFTAWFHYLFVRFLNYFLDIVIVTSFRIVHLEKSLYIKNNRDVIDLHEIQDMKKIQNGIIRNLLNYGKLIVVVPTMIEPLILPCTPNPDRLFRKITNSKRDYIANKQRKKLDAIKDNRAHQDLYEQIARQDQPAGIYQTSFEPHQ